MCLINPVNSIRQLLLSAYHVPGANYYLIITTSLPGRPHCHSRFIGKIAWAKPKSPSMDDWIQKMWHIYTYDEILSAIRKDEILPFVTTWVDLGSIMLSCTK